MNDSDPEDKAVYHVVVNHEEQYSIWPVDQPRPAGWTEVGKAGSRSECLAYIKDAWTDMRPASLRRAMAELAGSAAVAPPAASAPPPATPLVDLLSQGRHPVELGLRPERSVQALARALDHGVVHARFTATRGGTELGVQLDRGACDLSRADLQRGTGAAHLEGELTLNFVKLRCVIDVDLATLAGAGHLVKVAP